MTFNYAASICDGARAVVSLFVRQRGLALASTCVILLGACQPVLAAPINYGDFSGDTVDYLQVTEDSNSGDSVPLFGAPTVSGDSLDFNPVGFSANASGGGADITDGQLKFTVKAKDGVGPNFYAISNISLSEAGDTTLAGFGTDATTTAVFGNVFVNIHEVDGIGINAVGANYVMSFTPSGGTYGLGTDGGGGPLYNTAWKGSLLADLNALLTANNIPFVGGATKVTVNLDNTLIATSETGTATLIAKKDFGGLSVTVNVPEPTSFLLAGFGLLALAIGSRRFNA